MGLMNTSEPPVARVVSAGVAQVPTVAALADAIWHEHYPGIISVAQIDYMLAKMYAPEVLRAEIQECGIAYDLLLVNETPAGFASYGPYGEPGVMKLFKLYLQPAWHGHGFGSFMLQHVERVVRAGGAHRLLLTVNKYNPKAIAAYQRNGFAITDAVATDFGQGFILDDYVMAKELTAGPV